MKRVLIIILCFASFACYAQNRNSVWVFGDSAGIDFTILSNPIPISSGMDGRGSCVSISDSIGNLIFYSYTQANTGDWSTLIHSNLNTLIQNGDSITGAAWYNELTIIPWTKDSNKYFLFSCGLDAPNNEGLYYSIVDMNLNNGLGSVALKNIQLNPNEIADCLTAVKHGNGRDWWLISKLSNATTTYNNRFLKYLIVGDSIFNYAYQDFNDARDGDFQKIIWNSSNDKFMLINTLGYMSEYNFDRCSGTISFFRNIFIEQSSNYSRLFWEGAYSPSGDIFYVSTNYWFNVDTAFLLQLNLLSPDIAGTIDTLERFVDPIGTGAPRLAPDGKIYFSRPYLYGFPGFPYPDSVRNNINENLSVIHSPDSLGASCNYQPFSFYLGGKRTYYGLPNNPNYDLGPLTGSVCDTLTVGISNNEQRILNGELTIFYHASWKTAFINAKQLKGKIANLSVYNITGQLIFQSSKNIYDGYFTFDLDMQPFADGLYIVNLQSERETLVKKFVKQ